MSEPAGEFLHRGQVLDWLQEGYGLPKSTAISLISTLPSRKFANSRWNFYRKAHIKGIMDGDIRTAAELLTTTKFTPAPNGHAAPSRKGRKK